MSEFLRNLLRALAILVALVLGLVGLLMSVCGGLFLFAGSPGSGAGTFFTFGLLALGACASLVYAVTHSYKKRTNPPDPPSGESGDRNH
ncbi:MAG: hypothetical protein ABSE43_14600 [Steroidobacteraceae bacterium]|jgi:hypothetical protein